MRLASVELERGIEAAIGGLLLAVVLAVLTAAVLRRWRRQRDARRPEPGVPALARFADTETHDILGFGGGAGSARIRRRKDTVTYGYLAVAEEYVGTRSGQPWCTLTVTLPGRVPFVVVDSVRGSGVPTEMPHHPVFGDPAFDAAYVVGAEEPDGSRVLSAAARAVLLDQPVQRLMLRDRTLLLRTFDGAGLDGAQLVALRSTAARFLASTPSFVHSSLAASGPLRPDAPLAEGLYGPDVA